MIADIFTWLAPSSSDDYIALALSGVGGIVTAVLIETKLWQRRQKRADERRRRAPAGVPGAARYTGDELCHCGHALDEHLRGVIDTDEGGRCLSHVGIVVEGMHDVVDCTCTQFREATT